MRTSVIVPVYNQLDYTKLCLAALDRHTPAGDWELIVVDNASTDGTREWLDQHQLANARMQVIRNEANLGFAAACNQGLAASKAEGMLILNNDVLVNAGWYAAMWRPMANSVGVGAIGPVSNNVVGAQQVPDVPYGDDLEAMAAFAAQWATRFKDQGSFKRRLSGFCLLVRRGLVDQIGGFDPRFGLGYYEDDDLCVRAGLAGFKLGIAAEVFVHHFGSRTFNSLPIDHAQIYAERWRIFLEKWGLPLDRAIEQGYSYAEIRDRWSGKPDLYVPLPR